MAAEAPTLRQRLVKASFWSVGGAMASHVLRLVGSLLMTRLLVPDAFGVMAIVLNVNLVMAMLSDVGLHQSVIRHPRGAERVFLHTVWAVHIVRGAILFGLGLLIAAGIGLGQAAAWISPDTAYGDAVLPWALAVSALGTLVHGFVSTRMHTAVRDIDLRRWSLLELTQQVVSLAVMLVLAWWTRSIWTIVIGTLVGEILMVVLSHTALPGQRDGLAWDREVLRELWGFGKWVVISSGLSGLAGYGGTLVLGGSADAATMGLFQIALNLAGAVTMLFERAFGSVLLPAFAEVVRDDPSRLPQVYRRARWRVDPVMVFSSGALCALGPWIIELLYDDRYLGAGPILSVLALSMLLTRYGMASQAYLAVDKPNYFAVLNVVRVVCTFTLIPLGLALGGLPGGFLAIALRELPLLPFIFHFNARHGLNQVRLEAAWLAFWPLGYAAGWAFDQAAHWLRG